MEKELVKQIGNILGTVRSKKPLIHHITNYVTVNDCANITLAIGASPIMADDIGEAETITSISSALVLNIGTLNERTIKSMLAAGKRANEIKIPVIFDPVGTGASELRNRTTEQIYMKSRSVSCEVICLKSALSLGLTPQPKGLTLPTRICKAGWKPVVPLPRR